MRQTKPLLLVLAGVMIGAALIIGWAGSALQSIVTVDWDREPQLIVSIREPGSAAEEAVEAISGVAAVIPTSADDLVSMGLDEDTGWNIFQTRTVIIEEGADFDEIKHQVSAIAGLDGYAVRNQERQEEVTWVRSGASGGSVVLDEGKAALVNAVTTWVWPILLLGGIGLAVYGLGVMPVRRPRVPATVHRPPASGHR